jgi:mannose/fructose/N-acetylgalactosamine-specific phosphotransferase system component IIC
MEETAVQPTPVASQTRHPWRSTVRTAVQVGIPAFVALVFILPLILAEVVEGMGETLPDGVRTWLTAAAAAITAVGATLARVMAIPGVNRWFTDHLGGFFAAEPRQY